MSGPLDRERLVKLFDELSAELRFSRTRAQIYIVGGAAMSLAFDRERTTRDVDARIDAGHPRLVEAVRKVGRRHGLGDTWLNDEATTATPRAADGRAETVYQSRHLTVTGASAKHLLAMKLLAARGKDREDIAVLCKHLGLKRPEEALRIYRDLFPDEKIKNRAREFLDLAFRWRTPGHERDAGPSR
ncbi:MAG: nucleotidyl transferase [Acidobacteria bacterium]|nr:nucleotidyl transferase [Acidobacteriota bacterium]MYJ04238.1 nucleotidyl transferase [Acidobacteriota bacterium]